MRNSSKEGIKGRDASKTPVVPLDVRIREPMPPGVAVVVHPTPRKLVMVGRRTQRAGVPETKTPHPDDVGPCRKITDGPQWRSGPIFLIPVAVESHDAARVLGRIILFTDFGNFENFGNLRLRRSRRSFLVGLSILGTLA